MNVDDEVLKRWYHARDLFLGCNYQPRNVTTGLELAQQCRTHVPEAEWLCSFCDDHPGMEYTFGLFMIVDPPTKESVFYAAILQKGQIAIDLAADYGHPTALGMSGFYHADIDKMLKSAGMDDRFGLYAVGVWYNHYPVSAENLSLAKKNMARACELGLVDAWSYYANCFCYEDDIERYQLLIRALERTLDASNIRHLLGPIRRFEVNDKFSSIVFLIGSYFAKHECDYGMFGETGRVDMINLVSRAVSHYVQSNRNARRAVNTWLLVARRVRVVKDIRKMVGVMIWEMRPEWQKN